MHEESLDKYVGRHAKLGSRIGPDARPNNFTVHAMTLPDTFQVLKYRVMEHLEDMGYRCKREKPYFNPSSRKMYFRDSDDKIAIMVQITHEPYQTRFKDPDFGRARVIVKRRHSAK